MKMLVPMSVGPSLSPAKTRYFAVFAKRPRLQPGDMLPPNVNGEEGKIGSAHVMLASAKIQTLRQQLCY
jgi:hypothetical protein